VVPSAVYETMKGEPPPGVAISLYRKPLLS
jgi:hypothetical protein